MSKSTDNKETAAPAPEIPANSADTPPGAASTGTSPAKATEVDCVAILQFTHDDTTYRPAYTERIGRKDYQHAPGRLRLSKAWAKHHIDAGNVVLEKDYSDWLAKQQKAAAKDTPGGNA